MIFAFKARNYQFPLTRPGGSGRAIRRYLRQLLNEPRNRVGISLKVGAQLTGYGFDEATTVRLISFPVEFATSDDFFGVMIFSMVLDYIKYSGLGFDEQSFEF